MHVMWLHHVREVKTHCWLRYETAASWVKVLCLFDSCIHHCLPPYVDCLTLYTTLPPALTPKKCQQGHKLLSLLTKQTVFWWAAVSLFSQLCCYLHFLSLASSVASCLTLFQGSELGKVPGMWCRDKVPFELSTWTHVGCAPCNSWKPFPGDGR